MSAGAAPSPEAMGLIAWASRYLEENGVIKPRLNAELLLAHSTGRDRTELYAYPEMPVAADCREGFVTAVERRAAHEPLQYITGTKGFRYLELQVDPRALIPRPETEMLVERAVDVLRAAPGHPVVVDVGTGSGCIALSLARECPAAVVYATDISDDALALARDNARRLALGDVVSFRLGDLCDALDGELAGRIDLIVCNPPYIREGDFPSLPPEVREHEPYVSLIAGPEGSELHRRLMEQAPLWLAPSGLLLMEGGEDQVEGLAAVAAGLGYESVKIHPDLNGLPRIVEGVSPPHST
ncbi:MAG: peptide chain release factor N(5)-glutamine methyltransferase [Actinobacteria bacterium]|nr:peptide chain release factor N(5)-glutamine methyltransferase [Actinomycetota bacterium]